MHRQPPRRQSAQNPHRGFQPSYTPACAGPAPGPVPQVCAPQLSKCVPPSALCIHHALLHCLGAHFPMAFSLFVKKFLTLSTTVEPSSASGGMMVIFSGMYLRAAPVLSGGHDQEHISSSPRPYNMERHTCALALRTLLRPQDTYCCMRLHCLSSSQHVVVPTSRTSFLIVSVLKTRA